MLPVGEVVRRGVGRRQYWKAEGGGMEWSIKLHLIRTDERK